MTSVSGSTMVSSVDSERSAGETRSAVVARHPANRPIFFQHLMKTGGTSVVAMLENFLSAEASGEYAKTGAGDILRRYLRAGRLTFVHDHAYLLQEITRDISGCFRFGSSGSWWVDREERVAAGWGARELVDDIPAAELNAELFGYVAYMGRFRYVTDYKCEIVDRMISRGANLNAAVDDAALPPGWKGLPLMPFCSWLLGSSSEEGGWRARRYGGRWQARPHPLPRQ